MHNPPAEGLWQEVDRRWRASSAGEALFDALKAGDAVRALELLPLSDVTFAELLEHAAEHAAAGGRKDMVRLLLEQETHGHFPAPSRAVSRHRSLSDLLYAYTAVARLVARGAAAIRAAGRRQRSSHPPDCRRGGRERPLRRRTTDAPAHGRAAGQRIPGAAPPRAWSRGRLAFHSGGDAPAPRSQLQPGGLHRFLAPQRGRCAPPGRQGEDVLAQGPLPGGRGAPFGKARPLKGGKGGKGGCHPQPPRIRRNNGKGVR